MKSILKKLIILYILNVVDILFTLILLRTNFFVEVNPIMAPLVQSPIKSILLKTLLPAVLFSILYYRMKNATKIQLKLSNYFISAALFSYAFIDISHMLWFSILCFFNYYS